MLQHFPDGFNTVKYHHLWFPRDTPVEPGRGGGWTLPAWKARGGAWGFIIGSVKWSVAFDADAARNRFPAFRVPKICPHCQRINLISQHRAQRALSGFAARNACLFAIFCSSCLPNERERERDHRHSSAHHIVVVQNFSHLSQQTHRMWVLDALSLGCPCVLYRADG